VKRLPVVIAALVVLVLAGGLAAYLTTGSGAQAFSVAGQSVSQKDLDAELRALADNEALAKVARQSKSTPVAPVPGSIAANYSAGWITLRINQILVDQEIAKHHLTVTAADRQAGQTLAVQLLGTPQVVRSLPGYVVDRFSRMAALQQALLTDPSSRLVEAALAQCPSRRYVANILVTSLAEAQAIKAQLDAGADFATLAEQDSIDTSSAQRGGELGCLDSEQFVQPFEQAAQTVPIGQVSDPVQTQYGFHLILVRDEPQPVDLASVALNEVTSLAQGAHVTLNPRYGTWDRRQGRVVTPVAPATAASTP